MALYRPRSFFTLVLLGFSVAVVPLTIGLINGAMTVNSLRAQTQRLVYRAVQATQDSGYLFQQIIAMERNAKQYLVLKDPALLHAYREARRHFQFTTDKLAHLNMDAAQREKLAALVRDENTLYLALGDTAGDARARTIAANGFSGLVERSRTMLEESNRVIEREVKLVQKEARRAERVLAWQALALIPGTFALAALFTYLISRPIRQIDRAIRRLGDGEFKATVKVAGPEDLRQLGARLDWLRKRLNELEEDKRRFLQHVSHELKTPLSAIREGAELLNDEYVGALTPQQREIAEILHNNSQYLQRLIEDLLNFNLAEARTTSMQWEDVPLDEVASTVAQRHKPALLNKHIQLRLDLAQATVRGDKQKLATVIDNLLSNAIKYTPDGGQIQVALQAAPSVVWLDVKDDGPGIAALEHGRIFDPFFQGEKKAKGHIKGTGLGLAIAKEYVAAHHGELTIVSAQRGAHFRMALPIKTGLRYAS